VGKKAAVAFPERDTKAVRTPPGRNEGEAGGEEARPFARASGSPPTARRDPEKALLRDDLGKEDGRA